MDEVCVFYLWWCIGLINCRFGDRSCRHGGAKVVEFGDLYVATVRVDENRPDFGFGPVFSRGRAGGNPIFKVYYSPCIDDGDPRFVYFGTTRFRDRYDAGLCYRCYFLPGWGSDLEVCGFNIGFFAIFSLDLVMLARVSKKARSYFFESRK